MIIQSKKVWIADQFVPAIVEMEGGKIVSIAPYGSKSGYAGNGGFVRCRGTVGSGLGASRL